MMMTMTAACTRWYYAGWSFVVVEWINKSQHTVMHKLDQFTSSRLRRKIYWNLFNENNKFSIKEKTGI